MENVVYNSGLFWSFSVVLPFLSSFLPKWGNFGGHINKYLGPTSFHPLYIYRVQLMCVLRVHIKLSIFGNNFSRIEKIVNTFSIFKKFFFKNENYCVPLGHTLKKSIYIYIYIYIYIFFSNQAH